ncbi:MAG: MFS transporter [Candidatus Marsarchaeota archaeon]|nr:MFS transporter [Candidatus Marsarchaeota archaeon]MCL5413529.1 MFS transporter [Candidatus Marsarchaeota archaeon]
MVQYKWIALSNTTLGVLMATINSNILLISIPAIFNGIHLNPLSGNAFQYLLWLLFGYNIITATLLVTFGRLSDMFGRVRLYNMGFLIFTIGSVLLFLTPGTGAAGALELIAFRIIQAIGSAFLFANSAAIITDAFPYNERGKALGINQVAALVGSLLGLLLGGILAVIDWRIIFLVSVPVGIAGTIWSYLKLRELGKQKKGQMLDIYGNATFAIGLTLLLVGVTYGLLPYGSSPMGWSNPFVMASLATGFVLLIAFIFVEKAARDPMFRLELFSIRMFSAANIAGMLGSMARGGVFILLIILLQGIWLPLHGYSFAETPFWSGIYMIPMLFGFVFMGPLSGWLSDKHGARILATGGMVVSGIAFIILAALPFNFTYFEFAAILLVMGMGSGMFAAPNTASIMNSVPPENRGAASGMRATLQNTGATASLAIFFTIVILSLSASLPAALSHAISMAGAPQIVANDAARIPPTTALFATFLGYNPVKSLLMQLPQSDVAAITNKTLATITSQSWFPNAIAPSFMQSLDLSFYIGAALSFIAAAASLMRGKKYVHGAPEDKLEREIGEEEAADEVRIRKIEERLGSGRGRGRSDAPLDSRHNGGRVSRWR